MNELVTQARNEWDEIGVLCADTQINLSLNGIDPEELIEKFEEDALNG